MAALITCSADGVRHRWAWRKPPGSIRHRHRSSTVWCRTGTARLLHVASHPLRQLFLRKSYARSKMRSHHQNHHRTDHRAPARNSETRKLPQRETTPFYPRSPYAVAKLYAYWIAGISEFPKARGIQVFMDQHALHVRPALWELPAQGSCCRKNERPDGGQY